MFVSFFGPGMFFITLGHDEYTHFMSWKVFLPLKVTQFLIKLYSLFEFRARFFNLKKIHIKRRDMDCNIILNIVDILMEGAAFAITTHIGF
tara:strand:- start:200 stop:472 length:273 start_codon:yes stop_codon:yes gene_type:complete